MSKSGSKAHRQSDGLTWWTGHPPDNQLPVDTGNSGQPHVENTELNQATRRFWALRATRWSFLAVSGKTSHKYQLHAVSNSHNSGLFRVLILWPPESSPAPFPCLWASVSDAFFKATELLRVVKLAWWNRANAALSRCPPAPSELWVLGCTTD